MKTIQEIISHSDHVLKTIPGSVILSDEEWQTLKSAAAVDNSAQQLKPKMPTLEEVMSEMVGNQQHIIYSRWEDAVKVAYVFICQHFGH